MLLAEVYYWSPASKQKASSGRLEMLLMIATLIWLVIELIGYGPLFRASQNTIRIEAPLPANHIELDLGSGHVEIRVASDQQVRVETTQYGSWQGNPAAISRSADGVRVTNEARARPDFLGMCFSICSQVYRITVPRDVTIDVRTSSGDVNVVGLRGALSITTRSGDVEVMDGRVVGASSMTTTSGDVTLHLPKDSGFVLNASTNSGDLTSAFGLRNEQRGPQTLSGFAGAGGAELTIMTDSGDVEIERQ
jgi:hypothetical protein